MDLIPLDPAHVDERGMIIDLIAGEEINAVTLVTFTEGAVRGNHYHARTIQWNYIVSGEILMATELPGQGRRERVLKRGDFARSIENERHALKALSEAVVLVLTRGPRGGDQYEVDTVRLTEPLIEPAPLEGG